LYARHSRSAPARIHGQLDGSALLVALVWSAGIGLLQVAAGLHRLRGAHIMTPRRS
jgi:hypothetical protein